MPSTSHVYPSSEAGGGRVIETPFARAVSSAQRASSGFTLDGHARIAAMPGLCSCRRENQRVAAVVAGASDQPDASGGIFRRRVACDLLAAGSWRRALPARSISVCAGSDAAGLRFGDPQIGQREQRQRHGFAGGSALAA